MIRSRLGLSAVLILAACSATPAHAQFIPFGGGFNPYFGGGYGFGMDPYGGYMQGAASVIQAQGQYLGDYQKAKLTREQVRQSKVDTRRAVFDNWLYERAMTPSAQQIAEEEAATALRRALNNPSDGDIFSGLALNKIVDDIKRHGTSGPTIPLSPDIVRRINLSGNVPNSGNFGLFRNGGKFTWPPGLNVGMFKDDRTGFEASVADALKQAPSGSVDGDLLDKMHSQLTEFRGRLRKQVAEMTPNRYMESTRFLNDLDAGVTALGSANVAQLVEQKWTGNGTVNEFVRHLADNGLSIAPAVRGDEQAYRTLHQALVDFDRASDPAATTLRAPQPPVSNIPQGGGFAFPTRR